MTNLLLQPCSNKTAQIHFENSVRKSISIEDVRPLLSNSEYDKLTKAYPSGALKAWGVVSSQAVKWSRINIGDVALFFAKKKAFHKSIIVFKTQNQELAKHIWGQDKENRAWEYMYFLSDCSTEDIPQLSINRLLTKPDGKPYEDGNYVQGFDVLPHRQNVNFMEAFDLRSDVFIEDIETNDLTTELDNEDSLDSESVRSTRRKEQPLLRRILFKNNPISQCSICSEEMSVSLLIAAHIKKRADCSIEEKKDFHNIVASMCKLGCDDLYEKGFIGVKDGIVVSLNSEKETQYVKSHIQSLEGNSCLAWKSETKPYFDWHFQKHHNQ
jgi:hypothetical protein